MTNFDRVWQILIAMRVMAVTRHMDSTVYNIVYNELYVMDNDLCIYMESHHMREQAQ